MTLKSLLVASDWKGLVLWSLIAAALRVPPYLAVDLSLDETWTYYHTAQLLTAEHPLEAFRVGLDAPLFVAVNLALAKLFGLSVFMLRLPQLSFGVAAIALTRRLLGRLMSPTAATAATALAAFSPFLIYYSLEARPYAQMLCCSIGFALAWVESVEVTVWKRRLLLGALTFVTIASHYYAAVFFAAFYLAVFVLEARGRRFVELRRDFFTGLFTLFVSLPLLVHPLQRFGTLGVEYWKMTELSFALVLSEQLWFLGLNYELERRWISIASGALLALFALPVVLAWQRRKLPLSDPLTGLMGFLPQGLVAVAALFGQRFVFYPRGFIASTPFLFAIWVRALAGLAWSRARMSVYLCLCVLPLLWNSLRIVSAESGQPYFGDRRVMKEVARQVDRLDDEYDVLVVHQWWLAQYYFYYTRQPSRVLALGGNPRTLQRYSGLEAALADLEAVPSGARVLLALNRFADETTDPNGEVVRRLSRSRPLLREGPCLPESSGGVRLYCSRMMLFGAEPGSPSR